MTAGSIAGGDSIRPLRRHDIDFLTELESIRIGPFRWQKGVG